MADVVVDSCVVAKWLLPEPDSAQAHKLVSECQRKGDRLIVLDLAMVESTHAIWKRHHRRLMTTDDARDLLAALRASPVHLEDATPLLEPALEIAMKYDRALYDALFVALAHKLDLTGITADEPLHNAVKADFPKIVLLRDWTP